ncbi:hypothetical protein ZOSMA_161G00800 [Zostera marina]|uniref:Uncharacterized protein n=1 Tax=Zostera marina TaxID=29655 RepID=A0A0K9PWP5_ZOSMR|nr:hypothetical protein ZOSMA_161G00800 [Zostera marina]
MMVGTRITQFLDKWCGKDPPEGWAKRSTRRDEYKMIKPRLQHKPLLPLKSQINPTFISKSATVTPRQKLPQHSSIG